MIENHSGKSHSLLKGSSGKSVVPQILANELTRPQGKWREFWTKHLRRISADNRLPRGFVEPKPLDFDSLDVHRKPVIKHANDAPICVSDLREAIQGMKTVATKKR